MEKYIRPEMEIVEFECEDVITTSSATCGIEGFAPDACGADGHPCFDFGCRVN